MVSGQLDDQERELVANVSKKLDGVPYVEKARIIRASLESARRGHRPPRVRRARAFGQNDRGAIRIA